MTQVVKNIGRAMRRRFSAEDKIGIVLEGLRGATAFFGLAARKLRVADSYQCLWQPERRSRGLNFPYISLNRDPPVYRPVQRTGIISAHTILDRHHHHHYVRA